MKKAFSDSELGKNSVIRNFQITAVYSKNDNIKRCNKVQNVRV
jgi:hypothetical protein